MDRREALKALAAASGAVFLANLPDKWETPLIETGTLPAHAQVSCTLPGLLALFIPDIPEFPEPICPEDVPDSTPVFVLFCFECLNEVERFRLEVNLPSSEWFVPPDGVFQFAGDQFSGIAIGGLCVDLENNNPTITVSVTQQNGGVYSASTSRIVNIEEIDEEDIPPCFGEFAEPGELLEILSR
jgi:hypothetical protein